MKDIKDFLIALTVIAVMMIASFFVGRCAGQIEHLEVIGDTVVLTDTVKVPHDVIQTQVVKEEVVKYRYVPVKADRDTLHDTIIQIRDSVAIIPISLKTYTDSQTYKAVISGYDPRLEDIEVYQTNTVIIRKEEAPRWSIGLQGGVYMTPKGLQPGIGFGASWRIPIKGL